MFTSPGSWFNLFGCSAFLLGLLMIPMLSGTAGNRHGIEAGMALAHLPMVAALVWARCRLPLAPPRDPAARRAWLRSGKTRRRREKGEATSYRQFLSVGMGLYIAGVLAGAAVWWYRGP